MPQLFSRLAGRQALAWLKHRRWWIRQFLFRALNGTRVLEDGATIRVLEDGVTVRITEGG